MGSCLIWTRKRFQEPLICPQLSLVNWTGNLIEGNVGDFPQIDFRLQLSEALPVALNGQYWTVDGSAKSTGFDTDFFKKLITPITIPAGTREVSIFVTVVGDNIGPAGTDVANENFFLDFTLLTNTAAPTFPYSVTLVGPEPNGDLRSSGWITDDDQEPGDGPDD